MVFGSYLPRNAHLSPISNPSKPFLSVEGQNAPKVLQHVRVYYLRTDKCLVAKSEGGLVVLKACDYSDQNQVWIYNEEHELVLTNFLFLDISKTGLSDPP